MKKIVKYIKNPFLKFYQNYTETNILSAKEKIWFVPQYSIKEWINNMYNK